MVIHTEYRGERYAMGSSDPLPAGLEIRFRSLNFQTTGNGYLMRVTNRAELHSWRPAGPGLNPAAPSVVALTLVPTGIAGPSAPRRRRCSGQRSRRARADRRRATRTAAQHGALLDQTTPAPAEGGIAHESRFPHGMCNTAAAYVSSAGTDMDAYGDLPGYHC
jgi:hypothetical protein